MEDGAAADDGGGKRSDNSDNTARRIGSQADDELDPALKNNKDAAQPHQDLPECAVCGQFFGSRNQLFKHLRDSTTGCGTNPAEQLVMPPAPSAIKDARRREEYRQQRQQRRNNKTGRTVVHTQHCVWMGDLPLPWTRQGGQYKRLRALLWALLPRNVAPPWIKFVQRKAYRAKVALPTKDGNSGGDIKNSIGAYLGYAIVVFRDDQECERVMQLLDGREVTVNSVFGKGLLDSNEDFASMAAQNVPPFCLKVRPVENKDNCAASPSLLQKTMTNTLTAGNDPPLSEQLRPLPTKTLLARAAAIQKHSTVASPSTIGKEKDEHARALQLLVDAFQSASEPRPEVRHEGSRIIPVEIRDRILSILQNLRWPVVNHRSGLTAERYLVLPSNVTNDPFYRDLRDVCRDLMDWADPNYYFSGIAVTKNFVSSPHRDDRDVTFQYAASLGDFEAGGELCVDGVDQCGREVVHVVNTHNRIARVDGRHVHWVRTWEGGDRFSLIFYNTSDRNPTSILEMGVGLE